ncbi:hypothetical protein J6590_013835 [Homalodisca vitripennis]|nr:hypothetical protein J6590_013835 [Homalodisca vitripennis]
MVVTRMVGTRGWGHEAMVGSEAMVGYEGMVGYEADELFRQSLMDVRFPAFGCQLITYSKRWKILTSD